MDLPQRKVNRIPGFDYTQPYTYFVTVCTQNRDSLFTMEPAIGKGLSSTPGNSISNRILHKWIQEAERKFAGISIDLYVIMPDHMHLLLSTQGYPLPEIMGFIKTMTTNEYIREVKNGVLPPFHQKLWQKSYYDHAVRNQQDYSEIWQYIENNPRKWMIAHGKIID